jgi:hypothetical protein
MVPGSFAIGDRVRLSLATPANHNSRDVYTISRTLPALANVWQYRVRRDGDGQEMAVSESQLVMASPQLTDKLGAQQDLRRERNGNALGRARSVARRSGLGRL